jgi:hypothetical protein
MLPVLALILSAIEPSFAQTTSYYAVQNSIHDRCGKSASVLTSDFGCGAGLVCIYQNQYYSQCLENKAFNASAYQQQCYQPNSVGTGSTGSCAKGTYCHYFNEWYSQCRPCRTTRVTCGVSAQKEDEIKCCPGIFSRIDRLLIDRLLIDHHLTNNYLASK